MQSCPGCGLITPSGFDGCQTIFNELSARAMELPHARFHRQFVDIYCLQHPDPYMVSAKSMAAHVCGVCVAVEYGNDQSLIGAIHLFLNGPARFAKPPVPEFRGDLRIDSVAAAPDLAHYRKALDAWGRETWRAYAPVHAHARQWIEEMKAWRKR